MSGLFYLSYEAGEAGGEDRSRFFVNRAYLTARVNVLPNLSARLTLDPSQDMEGDGRGDMEVRIKYAHAKYAFGDIGKLTDVEMEGGIAHMVWLDFEEHINLYRMRDPMFMERSGMFNSADFGVTLTAGLGEDLPENFRENVTSSYAQRYGSAAVGLYNGGGYHGDERNTDKVLQGRLTLRPLPDALPGFQISGLGIMGKGNVAGSDEEIPDWEVFNLFLSYQHARGALTAQFATGEGNQKGTWTELDDPDEATAFDGFSFFGEHRLGSGWRVIAGFDRMNRTPGSADLSFNRVHGGIGYDLGRQNILLLDLDRRNWDDDARDPDTRLKMVMQVKF
ncbi:MAG: hypothetical protein R6T96_09470 [Longimicrobiales bacterium]